MYQFACCAVAVVAVASFPALAPAQSVARQDTTAVIEVSGTGVATQPADWASITGVVRAEAKDQQTALRLMSAKKDAIVEGLQRLAGAKSVRMETSQLSFRFVLPEGCHAQGDDGSEEAMAPPRGGGCKPTGVEGSVMLTASVHPAASLGSLASLAIQLGAEDVRMSDSGVDDQPALQAEAARAAFRNALAQATLLADAAHEHLGRLIHLNRGGLIAGIMEPRFREYSDAAPKSLPPPPAPITPDVALKLTPPKVTETSDVVVAFELVK